MTKSIRLSLVALALASTGIFSIESASAALICRGGHIMPAKCGNPLNANLGICFCSSDSRISSNDGNNGGGNGGGTIPDSDPPDEDTEVDVEGR